MSSSPPPLVASLEPLDRRARRVRVELDDGTALELALEVIERVGLGPGDAVDAALSKRLLDDDLRWRARETALGFLAYRPRSRGETQRRLLAAAFPAAVVQACLNRLAADGLPDDNRFADAFVRDRLHLKPRGPARLRHELRGKGIDQEVADAAIGRGLANAGVSAESLAVDVALRWLAGRGAREREALASERFGEQRDAALRRLVGFLQRRGFRGEAVRRAIAAVDEAVSRAQG
ncbi:MAG: regulatory protein RecX [Gemmatimonadetes bacterium]|nr:regulatory protein RecX [Gemmatimonadota bacterium]